MVAWFIPIIASLAISTVSVLLRPKPKGPKPAAVKDLEEPTAEAGRPVAVVFGRVTISGPNVLWYGDKNIRNYQVKG